MRFNLKLPFNFDEIYLKKKQVDNGVTLPLAPYSLVLANIRLSSHPPFTCQEQLSTKPVQRGDGQST